MGLDMRKKDGISYVEMDDATEKVIEETDEFDRFMKMRIRGRLDRYFKMRLMNNTKDSDMNDINSVWNHYSQIYSKY